MNTEQIKMKYDLLLIFAILGGKISDAMNKCINRNFQEYNVPITCEEWTVLYHLWERNGAVQQELCTATMKTKIEITRIINRMESKGLVVRRQSDEDHRANHIWLTSYAEDMKEKARFVANKTLKAALRGLTEEEKRICQESLKIIFKNIKD